MQQRARFNFEVYSDIVLKIYANALQVLLTAWKNNVILSYKLVSTILSMLITPNYKER